MNIESTNINRTSQTKTQSTNTSQKDSNVKFEDELKGLQETGTKETEIKEEKDISDDSQEKFVKQEFGVKETEKQEKKVSVDSKEEVYEQKLEFPETKEQKEKIVFFEQEQIQKQKSEPEIEVNPLDKSFKELTSVVEKLNQSNEKFNQSDEKFSQSDVKFNQSNEKLNQSNEKFNQSNEKLNQSNEKFNQSNEKFNQSDEKFNQSDVKFNQSNEKFNQSDVKFNQSDEKLNQKLKSSNKTDDNIKKGEHLINNDFNIQDNKDILPQMSPNMNFSGNGQPFSSFMGNENNNQNSGGALSSSASDLAEEAAILSTMAENIAMANKNTLIQESTEKVVNREEGIKKVDVKSGITIENIVKYDSIIMNEADVEVFASLAETGEANLDNLAPESAQKSVQVSKTLADMLAKAKETQQPLRIDFDNGISVIIKISRDGKVSADFLPSTQIAEAYLKENLPILKQRFEDKNLEYEELNRRERRGQDKEDNRKKGQER